MKIIAVTTYIGNQLKYVEEVKPGGRSYLFALTSDISKAWNFQTKADAKQHINDVSNNHYRDYHIEVIDLEQNQQGTTAQGISSTGTTGKALTSNDKLRRNKVYRNIPLIIAIIIIISAPHKSNNDATAIPKPPSVNVCPVPASHLTSICLDSVE